MRGLLAGCLGLCLCASARAEVTIENVSWQLAGPGAGAKAVFSDIRSLPTRPPGLAGNVRLRVVLRNRGTQEADGLVLRYALSARLSAGAGGAEGVWAVPFLISEKRVPKVGPDQQLEVTLDPSQSVDLPLSHYLRRTWDSGFWLDQIKLQMMLSPRRGAVETIRTAELITPVTRS